MKLSKLDSLIHLISQVGAVGKVIVCSLEEKSKIRD